MNEVTKTLCTRRSIRKFTDKQVPKEILAEILKCGTYAPSGRNKQSAVIVAIQNPKLIKKIGALNAQFFDIPVPDPFYGAPTLVVVLANKNCKTYIEDGCAVIMNILNAAFSLSVDSCWIHRAKETFLTKEGQELLASWHLTNDYVGIGNVILGYRAVALPKASPRKDDYIIYID